MWLNLPACIDCTLSSALWTAAPRFPSKSEGSPFISVPFVHFAASGWEGVAAHPSANLVSFGDLQYGHSTGGAAICVMPTMPNAAFHVRLQSKHCC